MLENEGREGTPVKNVAGGSRDAPSPACLYVGSGRKGGACGSRCQAGVLYERRRAKYVFLVAAVLCVGGVRMPVLGAV